MFPICSFALYWSQMDSSRLLNEAQDMCRVCNNFEAWHTLLTLSFGASPKLASFGTDQALALHLLVTISGWPYTFTDNPKLRKEGTVVNFEDSIIMLNFSGWNMNLNLMLVPTFWRKPRTFYSRNCCRPPSLKSPQYLILKHQRSPAFLICWKTSHYIYADSILAQRPLHLFLRICLLSSQMVRRTQSWDLYSGKAHFLYLPFSLAPQHSYSWKAFVWSRLQTFCILNNSTVFNILVM